MRCKDHSDVELGGQFCLGTDFTRGRADEQRMETDAIAQVRCSPPEISPSTQVKQSTQAAGKQHGRLTGQTFVALANQPRSAWTYELDLRCVSAPTRFTVHCPRESQLHVPADMQPHEGAVVRDRHEVRVSIVYHNAYNVPRYARILLSSGWPSGKRYFSSLTGMSPV